jgi:hypothetical protein
VQHYLDARNAVLTGIIPPACCPRLGRAEPRIGAIADVANQCTSSGRDLGTGTDMDQRIVKGVRPDAEVMTGQQLP